MVPPSADPETPEEGSLGGEPSTGTDVDRERVDALLREIARPSLDEAPGALARGMPLPGMVIAGKYRVERRIGAGGMGVVFEAKHTLSGKSVALKWMPSHDGSFPPRLLSEARAVARIRHPHVVDLHDVVSDDAGAYLVMELLRGETLAERIARGPLPERALYDVALPVLAGIEAAHRAGVIHRDLKPENVFLCEGPDGGAPLPKVLDFGISKLAAATSAGTARLTRDGAVLGTPAYMSPEQLRDPASADAQSDVYSVGVVLFEALSGELPFAASDRDALLLAIAEHRVRPLRELAPAVSPALGAVISRATAPDPARRFPNAAAFARALEEARDRPRPFSARWAWVMLAAALAGVGTAAAIAGSSSEPGAPAPVALPAGQRASHLKASARDLPVTRPAVTSAPATERSVPTPTAAGSGSASVVPPSRDVRARAPAIVRRVQPAPSALAGELHVEDL